MSCLKKCTLAAVLLLFMVSPFTEAKSIRGPKVTKCKTRSEICPTIYDPVCGYKPDIMCINPPCNYITYSNGCEACRDEDVESYTAGECTITSPPGVEVPIPIAEPEKCSAESREGDVCPEIYAPVCGYKPDIMCINPPCNYVNYPNSCFACHDKDVESYTAGECTITSPPGVEVPIPIDEPKSGVTQCTKDSREGDVCPMIYFPVCGYKPDIVCITTPCNYITYSNSCEACHDPDVASYTQGACPEETPVKKSTKKSSNKHKSKLVKKKSN